MSKPGQWKCGDVALFKPPFGCANAGRWLRVTLQEGQLYGSVRPHGCPVPGCRVWPRAETVADGAYRNVPECELAEATAEPQAVPAGVNIASQPFRFPPRPWNPTKTRLPYRDNQ